MTVQRACGDEGGAQPEEGATGLCDHGGQDRADLRLNAGAQSRSPRPNSLCVPLTVCPTPHAGHCIGCGQADGGRVPPQAQECAALSGLFRAGGFSPCRCHPGFRSCLRGSRWLPGQPWFSQRRKEARGGRQSVPCPQAPDLQVTPFPPVSTCTRGPERLSGGHTALQGSLEGAVRAALCARGLILEALGLES